MDAMGVSMDATSMDAIASQYGCNQYGCYRESAWMRVSMDTVASQYGCMGDSGGIVNSLDFCPASLKSLGCF